MVRPNAEMFNKRKDTPEKPIRRAGYLGRKKVTHSVGPAKNKNYRCDNGEEDRKYIVARNTEEAADKCFELFGFWPTEIVEKKEIIQSEHLMDRPFKGLDQMLKGAVK